MTSFHSPIVSWHTRTDPFILYAVVRAENIKRMVTLCFREMCKFCTVIGLDWVGILESYAMPPLEDFSLLEFVRKMFNMTTVD